MRLRVASFNLQAGIGSHAPGHLLAHGWRYLLPHRQQDAVLARAAAFVAPCAIVGVQEADAGGLRAGWRAQVEELAKLAGFPYHATMTTRRIGQLAHLGLGLLSRFPMLHVERHRLPGSRHGRGALRAELAVYGERWTVIVTHLSLRRRARLVQARYLAMLVERERTLLLGDLNCEPDAPEFRLLLERAGLVAPRPAPPTWPSWAPVRAIDHVLATPDLAVDEVEAIPTRASDHCLLGASVDKAARMAA